VSDKCICLRCGAEWFARYNWRTGSANVPKRCARCRSPYWHQRIRRRRKSESMKGNTLASGGHTPAPGTVRRSTPQPGTVRRSAAVKRLSPSALNRIQAAAVARWAAAKRSGKVRRQ